MSQIITRFAPSPTGFLHIGGLRTALFNYLYARANGGKFLLRIEDTDLARNSKEAADAIVAGFKWVGMEHDGEIVYQSERFDIYRKIAHELVERGAAYYCYMSKEELEAERNAAQKEDKIWQYDRRWRDSSATPPSGITPSIRIKAPLNGTIEFKDGVKGDMSFEANSLDDFIILRSDGTPTYNFCVVVDDAQMGITDIIRGDDHLSNTPKQIILYQALGYDIPRFFHVPMILGSDGAKLSKRHGATSVLDYRELGVLPHALLNFLLRLGFSHGDQEIFSRAEMLELFSPFDLSTSPSAYNADKLAWLNAHYIRELAELPSGRDELDKILKELDSRATQDAGGTLGESLCRALKLAINHFSNEAKAILYPQIAERVQNLLDFAELLAEAANPPQSFDSKMQKKIATSENLALLGEFAIFLENSNEIFPLNSESAAEKLLDNFCQTKGIESKKFFAPLRYALLGKPGGIGVCTLLAVLSKQDIINRLKDAK